MLEHYDNFAKNNPHLVRDNDPYSYLRTESKEDLYNLIQHNRGLVKKHSKGRGKTSKYDNIKSKYQNDSNLSKIQEIKNNYENLVKEQPKNKKQIFKNNQI